MLPYDWTQLPSLFFWSKTPQIFLPFFPFFPFLTFLDTLPSLRFLNAYNHSTPPGFFLFSNFPTSFLIMSVDAAEGMESGLIGAKRSRRRNRLAEKKVERDRWQDAMATQDALRMSACRRRYHDSLRGSVPLQPAALYPVTVDCRTGIFMAPEATKEVLMLPPNTSELTPQQEHYRTSVTALRETALFMLAEEMQAMQGGVEAVGVLGGELKRAYAKGYAVVAAVALLATATHYEKGYGVVAVFPVAPSLEVVEMAFFAHGALLRTSAEDANTFTCYYSLEADAHSAVLKMNGRIWKNGTLSVKLV